MINSIVFIKNHRIITFIILFLTVVFFSLLSSNQAFAATDTYPASAPDHWLSSSVGSNTGINGIYLNAPYSYTKIRYNESTAIMDINIRDACWWNSVDGGTFKPASCRAGDVTIWVCASDLNGNFDPSYKSSASRCWSADPATFWFGNGMGTQLLRFSDSSNSIPSTYPLNVNPVGGYYNLFMIVSQNVGGLNGFRLQSVARNASGTNLASLDTTIGLGGQFNFPLSIVNLPLVAGGNETFSVRFQVPCVPARNRFNLGWFDADRPPGGIPMDTDIRFTLRNITSGQQITSATWASRLTISEDAFLLSQGQERIVSVDSSLIRVQAGDEYIFEWYGVNSNNGIQVKIPFDEADAGASCNPPTGVLTDDPVGSPDTSCSRVNGTANDLDSPGSGVNIRVYRDGPINLSSLGTRLVGTYADANNTFSINISNWQDFGTREYFVYAQDINQSGTDLNTYVLIGREVVGPCLRYTCGQATSVPAEPEANEQFRVTVNMNVVDINGNPASIGANARSKPWAITMGVTPNLLDPPQVIGSGTILPGQPPPGGVSAFRDLTYPTNGLYDVTWYVSDVSGGPAITPPGVCGAPDSINIVKKPYARFYAGDVSAGNSFESAGCLAPVGSRFIGFNKGDAGIGAGAGVNLGAFSRGRNVDFASAVLRTAPGPIKGLTFANTGSFDPNSINSNNFGGELADGYFGCIPDLYAVRPTGMNNVGASLVINNGTAAGDYESYGPITTVNEASSMSSTGEVQEDRRITLYVLGDVFIEKNITYENTTAFDPDPSLIPSFRLIVQGNIYIGPDVTELSGVFIAQPGPGNSGGRIYTCAQRSWNTNTPAYIPTEAQQLTVCNQKLTVYGSVSAYLIKLLRINGTLRDATANEDYTSGNQAESFILAPESWLRNPSTTNTSGQGPYQSIKGLPPIL